LTLVREDWENFTSGLLVVLIEHAGQLRKKKRTAEGISSGKFISKTFPYFEGGISNTSIG